MNTMKDDPLEFMVAKRAPEKDLTVLKSASKTVSYSIS